MSWKISFPPPSRHIPPGTNRAAKFSLCSATTVQQQSASVCGKQNLAFPNRAPGFCSPLEALQVRLPPHFQVESTPVAPTTKQNFQTSKMWGKIILLYLLFRLLARLMPEAQHYLEPKVQCHFRNEGYCRTWSITRYFELGGEGIDIVTFQCERDCAELGIKCESFVRNRDVLQMSCKAMDWERIERNY